MNQAEQGDTNRIASRLKREREKERIDWVKNVVLHTAYDSRWLFTNQTNKHDQ